jgi:hypothetical protein
MRGWLKADIERHKGQRSLSPGRAERKLDDLAWVDLLSFG